MVNSDHKNHLLAVVNGIKEPVVTNPVAPGLRSVVFKLFYILAEIGLLLQSGINIGEEFDLDAFLPAAKVLAEILQKLACLEYLKAIQRACPSSFEHRYARF